MTKGQVKNHVPTKGHHQGRIILSGGNVMALSYAHTSLYTSESKNWNLGSLVYSKF